MDSAGIAVGAQAAGAEADLRLPGEKASEEICEKLDEPSVGLHAAAMEVEVARPSSESVSAERVSADQPSEPASCAGVPKTYAKSEKVIDEADKEESKASFASLVKATCSKRSYPY